MSPRRLILIILAIFFVAKAVDATASDWKEHPKPNFPPAALEKNAQGFVRLRVVLKKNGMVDHVVIVQGSGNRDLDEAAQRGLLKWKMKRAAIKPSDIAEGREVIVDFKEEAAVAAIYRGGGVAWFASSNKAISPTAAKVWRSAPFPSYPIEARQLHEQGTVRLKVTIGENGNVEQVQVLQTSGHRILDDAAVRAVDSSRARQGGILIRPRARLRGGAS